MAAKRIQVSINGGTTWLTIPGSSGTIKEELKSNNDTIFGQDWESNEQSVGMWDAGCNGYFKGVSGYVANILQQGTPTLMTSEPCALLSGFTYRITNTTKRIIDYFGTVNVFDGVTNITANVVSIDYLNGEITLPGAPSGAVTITANYIPTVAIAKGRTFSVKQTTAEKDTTDYETARTNGGWKTFDYGLKSVSLDIGGVYALSNGMAAALATRNPVIVEIRPDNTTETFFRGYFKRANRAQSGDVGALEEENITFNLWVPDGSLVVRPFGWYFSTTGGTSALNQAIRNILTYWQTAQVIKVRYQHDPAIASSGFSGDTIITEATLSNTLEGLNEFRFGFRGTGAKAAA